MFPFPKKLSFNHSERRFDCVICSPECNFGKKEAAIISPMKNAEDEINTNLLDRFLLNIKMIVAIKKWGKTKETGIAASNK